MLIFRNGRTQNYRSPRRRSWRCAISRDRSSAACPAVDPVSDCSRGPTWTCRSSALSHDDTYLLRLRESLGHRAGTPHHQPARTSPGKRNIRRSIPLLLSVGLAYRAGVSGESEDSLRCSCWLLLPPLLWLIRVLYRRYGFPAWWAWLMVAVLAINPYVQLFSTSLAQRDSVHAHAARSVAAGAAIGRGRRSPGRTRVSDANGGFAAADRNPVCLRDAARVASRGCFCRNDDAVDCRMEFWSGTHKLRSDDLYFMYYVDYIGYEFYNVTSSNFLVVLWKNFDAVMTGMGSLILPFSDSPMTKILTQTIAVAMIAGIYRLARDREEMRAVRDLFCAFRRNARPVALPAKRPLSLPCLSSSAGRVCLPDYAHGADHPKGLRRSEAEERSRSFSPSHSH